MGRVMPSECPHGYIYDWGDFGRECDCDEDFLWGECEHKKPEHCPEGCNDPHPTGFTVPQRAELIWVGVDLDGTLAEPLWTAQDPTNAIGEPIPHNVAKLAELVEHGYKIVVYTSRPWTDYEAIEAWLNHNEIPFKHIQCGKPLFALYVDDRGRHSEAESWLPERQS